ncbi:PLC-like phosphodiesterase [Lophiotrema nucula]|uniref:PLC-like phosphodiesterase n=1 Tax=Lophiotrema nucula TaxID=690887 RepID=A0A6A5Z3V8_9PLEO|nr:PLC-like phosphodiesterase [Lophiotrema nucula]
MFSRTLLQAASLLPFLYYTVSAQTACNNSPSLCSKAYNNVTLLGAHDSPFLRDESTSFSTSGNQFYDSTEQLDAGVRLLSAQVHQFNDSNGNTAWHLCHSSCDLLDAGTLSSWLANISSWMDSNPNEVVTVLLVNSDDAPASELGAQFKSSGIEKYAYTPPSASTIPTTWPTLQSLISNGTRLVTFVASLSTPSSDYPYLMDEFTFIFENNFENTSPSNFSCDPNRPTSLTTTSAAASSGRMFLMNHFLYSTQLFGIETPDTNSINVTNAQTGTASLGTRISACSAVYAKAPWAVLVDFFNVGPAIASVDAANGVTSATGRKSVSTEQVEENDSGVSRAQGNMLAVVVAVMVAVAFGM